MKRIWLLVLLVAAFSVAGCGPVGNGGDPQDTAADPQDTAADPQDTGGELEDDVAGVDTPGVVTFSGTILPLLESNCNTCHKAGSAMPMTTYEEVKVYVDSGSLKTKLEEGHMNVGEDVAAAILQWIEDGAPE